jgi:heme/copper-type cytochrome/quinol oxidase subunit 4
MTDSERIGLIQDTEQGHLKDHTKSRPKQNFTVGAFFHSLKELLISNKLNIFLVFVPLAFVAGNIWTNYPTLVFIFRFESPGDSLQLISL